MTKRGVVFLLMPSVLFVWMAALALFYADALQPDSSRIRQGTEERIAELVRKAEMGEVSTNQLVELVGDAWRSRNVVHEEVAGFYSSLSTRVGFGVLFGVATQIYVIFRFKAGLRKRDA